MKAHEMREARAWAKKYGSDFDAVYEKQLSWAMKGHRDAWRAAKIYSEIEKEQKRGRLLMYKLQHHYYEPRLDNYPWGDGPDRSFGIEVSDVTTLFNDGIDMLYVEFANTYISLFYSDNGKTVVREVFVDIADLITQLNNVADEGLGGVPDVFFQ